MRGLNPLRVLQHNARKLGPVVNGDRDREQWGEERFTQIATAELPLGIALIRERAAHPKARLAVTAQGSDMGVKTAVTGRLTSDPPGDRGPRHCRSKGWISIAGTVARNHPGRMIACTDVRVANRLPSPTIGGQ